MFEVAWNFFQVLGSLSLRKQTFFLSVHLLLYFAELGSHQWPRLNKLTRSVCGIFHSVVSCLYFYFWKESAQIPWFLQRRANMHVHQEIPSWDWWQPLKSCYSNFLSTHTFARILLLTFLVVRTFLVAIPSRTNFKGITIIVTNAPTSIVTVITGTTTTDTTATATIITKTV